MATMILGLRGNYNLYPNGALQDEDAPLPPLSVITKPETMDTTIQQVPPFLLLKKYEVVSY